MPIMNTLFIVFLLLSSKPFLSRVCRASSYSSLIRSDLRPRPTVEQPLSKIAIHKAFIDLHQSASIQADPILLGVQGEDTAWVNVELKYPEPSENDWVGVFSPANFNDLRPRPTDEQPLSKIAIHKAFIDLHQLASIQADPILLGVQGKDTAWVNVELKYPEPSENDWVGVFSPANFNASDCYAESGKSHEAPCICTAPIKYMFANHSSSNYVTSGKSTLSFQLINQRADFSFALFSGGLENPKLVAVSDPISFANPKAPVYPRLAHGKAWDEMTVTWTSGYNIDEAVPFVEWGWNGDSTKRSPAGTLTFTRGSMCGIHWMELEFNSLHSSCLVVKTEGIQTFHQPMEFNSSRKPKEFNSFHHQ